MSKNNEETQDDRALNDLLSQSISEEFAPFFETRVMAHIEGINRSTSFNSLEELNSLFQKAFRRITIPASAACLVLATVNVQASDFEMGAVSNAFVEAVFSIPPETLDQAAEL